MTQQLLSAFEGYGERTALIWNDRPVSYRALRADILRLISDLSAREETKAGTTVALCADYSPRSLALLLALLERGAIVAPITQALAAQRQALFEVAQIQTEIVVDAEDKHQFAPAGGRVDHPLLLELAREGSGGLILFSSGSAGKIKAVVHDGDKLLAKYATPRRAYATIPFMLFDHIGGINTILQLLSSGGTGVIAPDRAPETICKLIERHKVEVLPTTPTFLNLLLLSDYTAHDLSSLQILAYGAERMPTATLARVRVAFPKVQLIQNYGMSEVGIMRTKSESNDSLWMKLGGDGYQTRVRDGLLEIKAETAMVGYLNEASPFTEDGWLKTGDQVEVKGEFLRVLGRESDIIIVGGEKVYPAEVEDLIATMDNVVEVVVSSEPNAITGQIVKAEVRLAKDESRAAFRERMSTFLADKLAPYKIPQRVSTSAESLQTARLKKKRR